MNPALLRFHVDTALTAETLAAALDGALAALPAAYLHELLHRQRWFGSKTKAVAGVRMRDWAVLLERDPVALLALLEVAFADGTSETYHLPLAFRGEEAATEALRDDPASAILAVESLSGTAILYDAFADGAFCRALFHRIAQSQILPARWGTFHFVATKLKGGPKITSPVRSALPVRRLRGEQSNSSVVYGDRFILKGFRKLQSGINPDLEVSRFLTTRTAFHSSPPLLGYVEYAAQDFQASIAVLQSFVANEGDGWRYTLDHLRAYYDYASGTLPERGWPAPKHAGIAAALSADATRFSAAYLEDARRLGEITGQMHKALASDPSEPAFAPEPVTRADLERWVADFLAHIAAALRTLERVRPNYPAPVQDQIRLVVSREAAFRGMARGLLALDRAPVEKIRLHGDFHLGQVLRAEGDFLIVDFEGEPARSLDERRARHLAVKDVAGMLRSFDYAAHVARFELAQARQVDAARLEPHALAWAAAARAAYLDGYFAVTLAQSVPFLPPSRPLADQAIAIYELDKAVYELDYEANNRPDWLTIPLQYFARL